MPNSLTVTAHVCETRRQGNPVLVGLFMSAMQYRAVGFCTFVSFSVSPASSLPICTVWTNRSWFPFQLSPPENSSGCILVQWSDLQLFLHYLAAVSCFRVSVSAGLTSLTCTAQSSLSFPLLQRLWFLLPTRQKGLHTRVCALHL